MRISIPATLTADYSQYDPDTYKKVEGPGFVVIRFGDADIVTLPAVREATDYYRREEEEEEIAQETVARWLREKLVQPYG